ncbi:MAG: hypothetical protein AAGA11_10885 [Pseudomonadota bacterium]
MIDLAIVLIGCVCFATISVSRKVMLVERGGAVSRHNGSKQFIQERRFTRFMHLNLAAAGVAIAVLLFVQSQNAVSLPRLLQADVGAADAVAAQLRGDDVTH